MIWLTKQQILSIHSDVIEASGGMDGVRDEGILTSALSSPLQTYDGKELFPTLIDKVARLAYGLTQNHPFIDGNKRIGAHAMLVTLGLNGVSLNYTQQELAQTFWSLASSELSCEQLKNWIQKHTVP